MTGKSGEVWLKAATAGSLWASVEIVLGSFLHNLRVPFAGTILAVMGISLMIGFQYKWKEKGLIWRAGFICAIMKSLSPSAIILGPMIGILTEAVLLDAFIRFLGRNPAGYLFGSIAAVLSALVHKVVTIIILYGFNIVTILENMYHYAEKQLKIKGPDPVTLIIYLIILYIAFGIFATLIGILAGKRLAKPSGFSLKKSEKSVEPDFSVMGNEKYSMGLLVLHLIVLITGLYLINKAKLAISVFAIAPYIAFLIFKYKRAMRRLAKPLFWMQLIVILVVAVIFWNEYSTGSIFQSEGFVIGIKMILRALMVVMVFSAVSVELRNPVVKTILFRRGFSRLYTSLSLAFSVLPGVMKRISKPGIMILNPVKALSQIIFLSESIYNNFREQMGQQQPVYIIAGDQREGKTIFLKDSISLLKEEGIEVEGIMAEGMDEFGKRTGFELVNVSTGKKILLCSIHGEKNWVKTGKYFFNPGGLEFGKKILSGISSSSVLVIDEIGPLELSDRGWAGPIQNILARYDNKMIWVVRRNLTEKIIQKFDLKNVTIIDIARYKPAELINWIIGGSNNRI